MLRSYHKIVKHLPVVLTKFIPHPLPLRILGCRPLTSQPSLTSTAPSAIGFDDYEIERRNFRLDVPEYYNFASDMIDQWAKKEKQGLRGSNPAFWWVDSSGQEIKWSFQQLSENSKRTARMLSGPCNIGVGERVIVLLPRVPQWWLINIAAIRIGAVLIPGTTQLTSKDIKHRIEKSQATAVIVHHTLVDKTEEVLKDCPSIQAKLSVCEDTCNSSHVQKRGWLDFTSLYNLLDADHECLKTRADDPMTIFFTSGTTGAIKMAEHTHASYGLAHTITGRYWLDLTPDDIFWSQSDTGWAKAAWSNLFAPWIQGACVFIHNSSKFDPQEALQVLSRYPVSVFCTAPTAYRIMVQEDLTAVHDKLSVRHCVSAGEPLNPEVIETWYDGTGQLVREGYGQSETVLQCCTSRCVPNRPGSMGKPPPGMDVRIIDANGEECAHGEEGEVAIKVKPQRPTGMFSRYVDEPERTAAAFQGDYYLSGDRAKRDEDGYLWFVSRSDDVIISAGYRIGPFEVESALIEHPAVAESAVVSSPDKTRGEVVKAFVVRTKAHQDNDENELAEELKHHVRTTTAPYKYPRKIEFVDTLPKTVSGKIRRVELRSKEWEEPEKKTAA